RAWPFEITQGNHRPRVFRQPVIVQYTTSPTAVQQPGAVFPIPHSLLYNGTHTPEAVYKGCPNLSKEVLLCIEAPLIEPDLINQARQGDDIAWEKLVRDHQEAVFRMAYLMLGDAQDAEDVAQETFVRSYRALHTFDAGRA